MSSSPGFTKNSMYVIPSKGRSTRVAFTAFLQSQKEGKRDREGEGATISNYIYGTLTDLTQGTFPNFSFGVSLLKAMRNHETILVQTNQSLQYIYTTFRFPKFNMVVNLI